MKVLFSIILVFTGSFAFGADAPVKPKEFLADGREIPIKLIQDKRIPGFGSFSLAEFIAKMTSYTVISARLGEHKSVMCRSTGRQDAETRTITVDPASFRHVPTLKAFENLQDIQNIVALHEYLGIEGYGDDHLQLSIPMWLLSLDGIEKLLSDAQRDAVINWLAQNSGKVRIGVLAMGGVSGGPGGGEGMTVNAKVLPILLALQTLRNPRASQTAKDQAWGDIQDSITSTLETFRDITECVK